MTVGRWIGTLVACLAFFVVPASTLAQTTPSIEGSRWAIVEVFGEPLSQEFLPHIVFEGRGRLSGRTACNWFHGSYAIDGDGIVILTSLTTLRGCEVDGRRLADPTFEALDSSARFAITGSSLTLSTEGGEPVARLERRTSNRDDARLDGRPQAMPWEMAKPARKPSAAMKPVSSWVSAKASGIISSAISAMRAPPATAWVKATISGGNWLKMA